MPEVQQQLPSTSHSDVFLEATKEQVMIEGRIREEIESISEAKKSISGSKVINGKLMSPEEQELYYDNLSQGMYAFLITNCNLPYLLTIEEASSLSKKLVNSLNIKPESLKKSPKLDYLMEFSENIMLEPDSKLVIFTEFARMARVLHEKLGPKSILYTGALSENRKFEAIEKFRNDPNSRILISTSAGSTGVNAQCANYLVHYDLPFNPTEIEQRNGRIDRTGNPFPNLQFTSLLIKDSYEEDLLDLLEKKEKVSSSILTGS